MIEILQGCTSMVGTVNPLRVQQKAETYSHTTFLHQEVRPEKCAICCWCGPSRRLSVW